MYQTLRAITYYFFSCLKAPLNHSCKPNNPKGTAAADNILPPLLRLLFLYFRLPPLAPNAAIVGPILPLPFPA